jgi:mannose-6-phosphate isomerase-like protein (cupin superfamily)
MKARIIKRNIEDEFYTNERCFIIEMLNAPDDESLSIAEARVEPGITTRWHYLDGIDERYLIVSGRGKVEIGSLPSEIVSAGDVVTIPAGTKQRITNIDNNDLIFYCICTPGFRADKYIDVEETGS